MKTNFLIVGAEGVKPEARGPHLDQDSVSDCGDVLAALAWSWMWLPRLQPVVWACGISGGGVGFGQTQQTEAGRRLCQHLQQI